MASKTVAPPNINGLRICAVPQTPPQDLPAPIPAVAWMVKSLGISRQRATRLLASGRVLNAFQMAPGEVWLLPAISALMVYPGRRGPRLQTFGGPRPLAGQSQKAKTRRVPHAGLSVLNPNSGGSNHGIRKF